MDDKQSIPGSVGEFREDIPLTTVAIVRPYIVAILLHRGRMRLHEVVTAMVPLCPMDDLKAGWDSFEMKEISGTRLEHVVGQAIEGLQDNGIIMYDSRREAYFMNPEKLTTIISWLTTLDARMPREFAEQVTPWYAKA